MTRYVFALVLLTLFGVAAFPPAISAQTPCAAPELICKAAVNQDRSLYVRDHCRYEQKIYVERFKLTNGAEKMEEVRETGVLVQPANAPDKTGNTPVDVRVMSDTDKKGNPKGKVNADDKTLLSFGAVWDLAFFPLLPEKLKNYNFQEVVAERKTEKWYRFAPKPEVTDQPLASGVVMLDPQTGEVMTIKIEGLHNLDVLDKNAGKLKSFYATIDYSQFQGALRSPTLASGGGVSDIPRFGGSFRFKFQEGKYVIVSKID
ncbi:MAG: hypothetical protein HY231_20060 [Acidobacteria bacterium]|nr:hypothetical protein [Acidobacteriota bacterium]